MMAGVGASFLTAAVSTTRRWANSIRPPPTRRSCAATACFRIRQASDKPPMNFDRIAPHYRWIEMLCAGPLLQRCRTAFLAEMPSPRHALIVGEGNGRFLVDFLRAHPEAQVTCVEASAAMLRLAQARLAASGLDSRSVEFLHADILDVDAAAPPLRSARHAFLPRLFPLRSTGRDHRPARRRGSPGGPLARRGFSRAGLRFREMARPRHHSVALLFLPPRRAVVRHAPHAARRLARPARLRPARTPDLGLGPFAQRSVGSYLTS